MKLGILMDFSGWYNNYKKACEELGVEYEIIDLISDNWINNIRKSNCDGYLVRPNFQKQVWKDMDDEKLFFIEKILNKKIYPNFLECFIYENKKNMSYWLEINNIKHPKTHVFYKKEEAIKFFETAKYPLVFKPNIGSAANGILFLNNSKQAKKLTKRIFTKLKFVNFGYTKWIKTRYGFCYPQMDDKQYNFMIVQEKLDVKCEWRMIKIGESYFGHQKLEKNGFHSGSGLVGWVKPPIELLNMTKKICELGKFSSMDIDIFETRTGEYYVNELQTIFGSYNQSQMYINDIPGRFRNIDGEWIFEKGYFNKNASCNLRVEDFVNQLNKKGETNVKK